MKGGGGGGGGFGGAGNRSKGKYRIFSISIGNGKMKRSSSQIYFFLNQSLKFLRTPRPLSGKNTQNTYNLFIKRLYRFFFVKEGGGRGVSPSEPPVPLGGLSLDNLIRAFTYHLQTANVWLEVV